MLLHFLPCFSTNSTAGNINHDKLIDPQHTLKTETDELPW